MADVATEEVLDLSVFDFGDPSDDPPPSDAPSETPAETPPETPAETPAAEPAPEAGAAAVPPTAAAVSPPALQPLSDSQYQRASQLGISPEALQAAGNPELVLAQMENVALRSAIAMRQQQVAPQQQQVQPPQPPATPDFEAYRKGLLEKGYEENLADALVNQEKRIHELNLRQYETDRQIFERDRWNAQAYQSVQNLHNQQQQLMQRQAEELIHRDFNLFASTMDPKLKELATTDAGRREVFNKADIIIAGCMARGIQPPSNTELFDQATKWAFADKLGNQAVEQVRAEVKAHQERAITRPTTGGKSAPTGTPDERAARLADEWYRKNGLMDRGLAAAIPQGEL